MRLQPGAHRGARDPMRTWSKILLAALAFVACAPAAFVVTFLLRPLWDWFERTTGIESLGHAAPADWCFLAVYALLLLGAVLVALATRRSRSPGRR
jgi:hypothetical protein